MEEWFVREWKREVIKFERVELGGKVLGELSSFLIKSTSVNFWG